MLREVWADPPAVGAVPRRVCRDCEKAPRLLRITAPSSNPPMILRRLRTNHARSLELLVPVVLVPPAVSEALAQTGASDLPAQLGPEGGPRLAGAAGHRPLDVAQLGLHVCLKRGGDGVAMSFECESPQANRSAPSFSSEAAVLPARLSAPQSAAEPSATLTFLSLAALPAALERCMVGLRGRDLGDFLVELIQVSMDHRSLCNRYTTQRKRGQEPSILC
jgi:hypothetical protein